MKKITPYGLELIAEDGLSNVDMTLHLFSNDYTPTDDGDFDVGTEITEMTADGYDDEDLLGASWSYAADVRNGYPIIEATQDQIDFVLTGAGTAYGWYAIHNDGTDDHVVWAERFSSAAEIGAGGGTISINPLHVFGVEEEAV